MADVEMEPKVCTFYYKEDFDNVENIGAIAQVVVFPASSDAMIFEGKIGEKYGFMEIKREDEKKDSPIILSWRYSLDNRLTLDDGRIIFPPNGELVEYKFGSKEYNDKFAMVKKMYRGM